MSTASYGAMYDLLSAAILAPVAVSSVLGARLYYEAADAPAFPYSVLRLVNDVAGDGANEPIRTTLDAEIMLFGRPRSTASRPLMAVADAIDGVMLDLVHVSDGHLRSARTRLRDTLPPGTGDIARDVVQIRLLYSLVAWPSYLITALT